MSTVDADLVSMLKAASGVTTLTSTTRIWPVRFPPETDIPAGKAGIVYTQIAGGSTSVMFGGDSGLSSVVYQLDGLAHTHAIATQLREAMRAALVGKSYGRIRKITRTNLGITVWERDISMWRVIFDVQMECEAGT